MGDDSTNLVTNKNLKELHLQWQQQQNDTKNLIKDIIVS